ncbi:hypothetical protein BBJ28_00022936 [Nothophytophthora sp. Chile5]|nr:hypothetical protein BBJ28_00022936 [Nothophytophthora sp. Chile5]
MGQGLWTSRETCDLSEEQIEEIHMLTSRMETPRQDLGVFPPGEIHRIRRKYKLFAKREEMTKGEFYALPAIAVNPLRDRLFAALELSPTQTISFAVRRELATLGAFKIHDFDADGKISREDLRAYGALVFPEVPEGDGDALKTQQEVEAICILA